MTEPAKEAVHKFPCPQCAADIEYAPGVGLQCPYCGYERGEPQNEDQVIEELDFETYLTKAKHGYEAKTRELECKKCGAKSTLAPDALGTACAFCGSPVVVHETSSDVLRPEGVLPFKVTRQQVTQRFVGWVNALWFAPNALKSLAQREGGIQGVYRPHFTYDASTQSFYKGERGEHYWVEESYRDSDGKTKSRRVQKTRWHPASGVVRELFDDVLVPAGRPLEWGSDYELGELRPYDPGFLTGWQAERYSTGPDKAWPEAKKKMDVRIRALCQQDIGGDEQRVHTVKTSYNAVRFKHILLPLYLSSYRYGGKVYRFQVNGQSGHVNGERPWSVWKIFFFVSTILSMLLFFILTMAAISSSS